MKAKLDTTGNVWTPIVISITLDTEEEWLALKNIYSVQEVTSLDADHRARDRNMLTNLVKTIVNALSK
tara:strand:- start:445 stop:648 length:204 start_codon:yes stop_codon:yes gene_type:complete